MLYFEDGQRKNHAPSGFQTHDLMVTSFVLNLCATTAAFTETKIDSLSILNDSYLLGEEFWLFITVFPFELATLQLRLTKFTDSGSGDVKIKRRIIHQISTKNRRCK